MKPEVQLLKRALKKIEIHGWCRNVYENKQGHFCSAGAINACSKNQNSSIYWKSRKLLEHAINNDSISNWNDSPTRRKAHVVTAFKKAIELGKMS